MKKLLLVTLLSVSVSSNLVCDADVAQEQDSVTAFIKKAAAPAFILSATGYALYLLYNRPGLQEKLETGLISALAISIAKVAGGATSDLLKGDKAESKK